MWPRMIAGAVLGLVGLVWFGQGIGVIGGSFMSGQAVWAVIGAVMIVFAILLVRGTLRPADDDADDWD